MTDINSQLKSHDKILSNIIKQLNTTNSNTINKLTELTKLTSYTSSQFDKHYTQLNNTADLSTNINIPRQSVTTSPPNTHISTPSYQKQCNYIHHNPPQYIPSYPRHPIFRTSSTKLYLPLSHKTSTQPLISRHPPFTTSSQSTSPTSNSIVIDNLHSKQTNKPFLDELKYKICSNLS